MKEYPLHDAAEKGDEAQVRALLARGFDINQQDNLKGHTPLHVAASREKEAVAEILLNRGADVNKHGYLSDKIRNIFCSGHTPLHQAVFFGRSTRMIRLLLERGAIVDCLTVFNETPLHFAANTNFLAAAQILLEYGANVNHKDKWLRTPIFKATYPLSAQLLLSHGAYVNVQNNEGRTPLQEMVFVCRSQVYEQAVLANFRASSKLIKEHMTDNETQCPVCLEDSDEVAIEEHAATPCCHQFICRKDKANCKACPLCRKTVGWE